jgi:hypothetical protein
MSRKNKFKSGDLVSYGTFNTEYIIIIEDKITKHNNVKYNNMLLESISYKCLFPTNTIDSIGESSLTLLK